MIHCKLLNDVSFQFSSSNVAIQASKLEIMYSNCPILLVQVEKSVPVCKHDPKKITPEAPVFEHQDIEVVEEEEDEMLVEAKNSSYVKVSNLPDVTPVCS